MAQSGERPPLRDSYRWQPTSEDIFAHRHPISQTEDRLPLAEIPRDSEEWRLNVPASPFDLPYPRTPSPPRNEMRRGEPQIPEPRALRAVSAASSSAAAAAPAPPPPQEEPTASKPEVIPGLTRKHLAYLELCRLQKTGLHLSEGDVLVIIDYPAHPKDGPKYVDCYGTPYPSQEFRVHSSKLRATRSSKFAEMLSPAYQVRARRRKRFADRTLPEGIDYVLDLTPPSEGDDLAFQMTRLSLTRGIVDWWANTSLEGDDVWMVDGHDDVCACKRPTPIAEAIQQIKDAEMEAKAIAEAGENAAETTADAGAKPATVSENATKDQWEISGERSLREHPHQADSRGVKVEEQRPASRIVPSCRNVPDYSPVRHRNSIVRLLMLIQGWDIMLDSANRVWSLVAVASIWDCASVVKDRVAQWIMCDQNIKFVEALPEEALRISFDLQLVQVARCAFRILANELAIEQAATPRARVINAAAPPLQQEPTRNTVFGRRKGNLDDELMNMVQHAARALVERMSSLLTSFQNPATLPDLWTGREWTGLGTMERVLSQEDDDECVSALSSLRSFMEAITRPMDNPFINALNAIPAKGTAISERLFLTADKDRAKYVARDDFRTLDQIMKTLNPVQKFLCPFYSQEFDTAWQKMWNWSVFGTSNGRPQYVWFAERFEHQIRRFVISNPQKAVSSTWDVFFNRQWKYGSPRQRTISPNPADNLNQPLIRLGALDRQFLLALKFFRDSHVRSIADPLSGIARHLLLQFSDDEMKFLPLWAGGLDDGTGGVFEDARPPAHLGPDGPGPAYHTGITLPSASSTSVPDSLLDGVSGLRVCGSTVVGSVDAQNSNISTVYGPREVSLASEPFTAGTSEFLDAALELPGAADWEVEPSIGDYPDDASDSTVTDFESMSMANEGASDVEDTDADGSIVMVNEQSDSEDSVVFVSPLLPLL